LTDGLEYRADTLQLSGAPWPLQIIVVPLLIGSLGVGVTRLLFSRRPEAPRVSRRIDTLQRA
jgi:hypothetical protein